MSDTDKNNQAGPFLPYGRQAIDDDDIAAVADILRSDWLTTGPVTDAFEDAFAKAVEAPFAVACSSGTAALHLAAQVLELAADDYVVVPAITFLATANAVRFTGAEVIFSDVDPRTGLMRPEDLTAALTHAGDRRVRAVFTVDLAGQPAAPLEIAEIAHKAGIAIVEDACHALGTRYEADGEEVPIGACRHADMATFSFHPVKTVATGEGGMVTTRDPVLAERVRRLRNHGMVRDSGQMRDPDAAVESDGATKPWYYEMLEPGYNYRASDIHCALGLSQLGKLDQFVQRRRDHVARYDSLLAPLAPVIRPAGRVDSIRTGWHLYVALIDFATLGLSRTKVMNALRDRGIGTQVHYVPVSSQPYYRDRYGAADLPGAAGYYEQCLSLPLFPAMADDQVDRVVEALTDICSAG